MKRTILGIGDVEFPDDWDEGRIEAEVPKIRKKYNLNFAENNPLVKQTFDEAVKQGVNPHTMIRLFNQESNFNPKAKAKTSSARGVAQLIDKTAKELGVTDPHDPDQAIPAGIRYFKQNLDRFEGDERKAIAAYHDGPTKIAATGLEVLSPAGADYLARVHKPWGSGTGDTPRPAPGAITVGGEQVANPAVPGAVTGRMKQPEEYTASVGPREDQPTGMGSSFLHGALGELYKQARGLGVGRLARSTPEQQAETQAYLDWKAKQNPVSGTFGGIAGAAPVGGGVGAMASKAVQRVLPLTAAKSAMVGGAAAGGLLNPGDPLERLGHAGLEGAGAGVLNKTLGRVAKPFQQREEVGQFRSGVAGMDPAFQPPLSIGSESGAIRSIGKLFGQVPVLGRGQQAAEREWFGQGMGELWKRATPPGQQSLLSEEAIKRGTLFQDTARQIRDAYDQALSGVVVPITARDTQRFIDYSGLMSGGGTREYLGAVDDVIAKLTRGGQYTRITGRAWQQAREDLQNRIQHFENRGDPAGRDVANGLKRVYNDINATGEGVIGPDRMAHLTGIDNSKATFRQMESAAGRKPSAISLDPEVLEQTMRSGGTAREIARGEALNQDIIQPMEVLSRDASIFKELPLSDVSRRTYPLIATALLGGHALGASGVTVPLALGAAGANLASGSRGAARAMYGATDPQRKLSELVRKYPAFMGGITGAEMSPSFRTRPLGVYDEEEE